MKRALVAPGLAPAAGRIAQLVEQLTLNQRVQGSSPCAPTNFPSERQWFAITYQVKYYCLARAEPDNDRTFSALPHPAIISGICRYAASVGFSIPSVCPSQLNGEPESQA